MRWRGGRSRDGSGPRFVRAARTAAAAAVLLTLLGPLPPAPAQPHETPALAPSPSPPNVLILLADDQARSTFDRALMPSVHARLVDRGVLFRRAYVNTPQCCPSRSELLTGLYQHHTGVAGNATPLDRPTIVELLHDRGYRTMLAGKYLNSAPCDPRPEFDRWVCSSVGGSGYSLKDPTMNVDGEWRSFAGPTGSVLAGLTARFIEETSPDRPFFALFAPTSPHLPANDPRHAALEVPLPRSPAFDEDTDRPDKPAYLRRGPLTPNEVAGVDARWHVMSRAVRGLDDDVRTILSALGDRADETLVVYLSDNGYLYGQHRRWEKDVPYEESVRVPLALRWPAVLPPARAFATDALVGNVDIAPTIADALGLEWNADGRSLLPLLRRAPGWERDAFLLESCQPTPTFCPGGQPGLFGMVTVPAYTGVVTARWKYVEYVTGERELYDLGADPAELSNLADAPARQPTRRALAATLRRLRGPPTLDTTIVAGPLGPARSRTFRFAFFSQPLDAGYRCRLTRDGVPGEWRDCSQGSALVGPLGDGEYVFEAAGEIPGSTDPTPAARAFSITTTGPPVRLDAFPLRQTRDRMVEFSFSSDTPVEGFECSLRPHGEPSVWAACASPVSAGPLDDGLWSFRVRARAGPGATAPPAEWLFAVDNAGPEARFSIRPSSPTSLTWAYFQFDLDEPAHGPVTCALDDRAPAPCSSGSFGRAGLGEGGHALVVRAVDRVGNAGVTRAEWTVDLTPPTVAITAGPRPAWPLPAASFTLASSEAGGFHCRLDGGPRYACGNPVVLSGLAEGRHELTAWAWDRATNLSEPATWSWTQDTIAPAFLRAGTGRRAFSPNGDGRADGVTLRARTNEPAKWFFVLENSRGGIVTGRYVSTPAAVFRFAWDGRDGFGHAVPDGPYRWTLSVNDEAGNGTRASGTVLRDTRAPATILGVHPPRRTPARTATFGFRSGGPRVTFACSFDAGGWGPCRPPVRLVDLAPGAHVFRVRATDPARNRGPAAVWNWTVVSR